MEITLVRKSPRLKSNVISIESTPIVCSRPSFELNTFTPSPVKKGERANAIKEKDKCININSSKSMAKESLK